MIENNDDIIKEDISAILDKNGEVIEDYKKDSKNNKRFIFNTNISLNKFTLIILMVALMFILTGLFIVTVPIILIILAFNFIFIKIKNIFNKK